MNLKLIATITTLIAVSILAVPSMVHADDGKGANKSNQNVVILPPGGTITSALQQIDPTKLTLIERNGVLSDVGPQSKGSANSPQSTVGPSGTGAQNSVKSNAAPAPAAKPAPYTSPAAKPMPYVAPAPVAKPVPYVAPAPAAKPMPYVAPAPVAKPVPYVAPAQAAKPMPYVAPAPVAKPVPYVAPAPAAKPMPYVAPAPAESFNSIISASQPIAPTQQIADLTLTVKNGALSNTVPQNNGNINSNKTVPNTAPATATQAGSFNSITAASQPIAPPTHITDLTLTAERAIAWGNRVSPEFRSKVVNISTELGADPNSLMAVMAFETGGTFDPAEKNRVGSGATGLIQFMPKTALGLHTTTKELGSMSAVDQLDYVKDHLSLYKGRLNTVDDTYMAVLYPKAVGKSDGFVLFKQSEIAYAQNSGLDKNGDGVITKQEAASRVRDYLDKGLQPKNINSDNLKQSGTFLSTGKEVGPTVPSTQISKSAILATQITKPAASVAPEVSNAISSKTTSPEVGMVKQVVEEVVPATKKVNAFMNAANKVGTTGKDMIKAWHDLPQIVKFAKSNPKDAVNAAGDGLLKAGVASATVLAPEFASAAEKVGVTPRDMVTAWHDLPQIVKYAKSNPKDALNAAGDGLLKAGVATAVVLAPEFATAAEREGITPMNMVNAWQELPANVKFIKSNPDAALNAVAEGTTKAAAVSVNGLLEKSGASGQVRQLTNGYVNPQVTSQQISTAGQMIGNWLPTK